MSSTVRSPPIPLPCGYIPAVSGRKKKWAETQRDNQRVRLSRAPPIMPSEQLYMDIGKASENEEDGEKDAVLHVNKWENDKLHALGIL